MPSYQALQADVKITSFLLIRPEALTATICRRRIGFMVSDTFERLASLAPPGLQVSPNKLEKQNDYKTTTCAKSRTR